MEMLCTLRSATEAQRKALLKAPDTLEEFLEDEEDFVALTILIGQLEVNVAETRAEAERRTEELLVAQQKYDDAVTKAARIQAEAEASATEAADAERNAGQVAAQLYRSGAGDLSVNLFLEAGDASSTDAALWVTATGCW